MADWDIVSETPIAAPQQPQKSAPSVTMETAPQQPPAQGASPYPGLDPDLLSILHRESRGNANIGFGGTDLTNAPKDETGFPIWDGAMGPEGKSHAAGLFQIQPGTWKPIAQKLGIHDFSVESQIRIANELKKEEGLKPWAASEPKGDEWAVTSNGKWKVSPESLASAQSKPKSDVVWMSPDDYLSMTPETERKPRHSLRKMLEQGDEVQDIPTLDVATQGERAKVVDQDGRQRALVAKQEGVDLIPVSIHGIGGDQPAWIEGMRGTIRPFNFMPVPKTPQNPQSPLDKSQFPYDQPGVYYGQVLPIAKDEKSGRIDFAMPEMIRSIVRGMISGGERATGTGQGGQGNPLRPLSDDEMAAAMAFAGGAPAASRAPVSLAEREPIAIPGAVRNPAVDAFLKDVRNVDTIGNAARDLINQRHAQDLAAGGAVTGEITNQLAAGRGEGMALADVAGENVRGLLGNVAREPGPGRNVVKQWAVNRLGDIDRDSPIATNIEKGIEENLATGSARTEARALAEQRAQAKPLWDKAMSGGSTAPLQKQLEAEFNDAGKVAAEAERELNRLRQEQTAAAWRESQAGNVYSTSAARRSKQFVDDKIAAQQKRFDDANAYKAQIAEKMHRAQADGTANAPGAVWSPYIGRLLKNPRVQEGIRRGYRIERDIADGEGKPLNPKEYAIVGEAENGDPIVGEVPNMKLLAVAKEGLDATLDSAEMTDPLTGRLTKAGRAVKILRDGLVNELDRLNPAYKVARDKWAGDSALIAAVRQGKLFHKQTPEEIAEWFQNASESEKNFYRLGAADTMRDDLQKTVFAGDPSKAIVNSTRTRNQLLPMFRSQEAAQQFFDRVKRARTMFGTPVEVLGNSKTAAREAEDLARRRGFDTAADVLHGVANAAAGHHAGALAGFGRAASRYFNPAYNPEREMAINNAVARLLTDPNVRVGGTGEQLLRSLPLPKVQNSLVRGMLNYSRKFAAPMLP